MQELESVSAIRTLSGKWVDILNLDPESICIEDIAHALSMMPRFGGHLNHFYSVAQHSYHCSYKVTTGHELAALLHDASEFVMMDMPRPIKNQLLNYKELENNLMAVIAKKYGFQFPFDEQIKRADDIMLYKEWNHFIVGQITDKNFIPMSQPVAKTFFLRRFNELLTVKNG